MRVERREGPTPFGGAYSIGVYLDDGTIAITEYAEDGTWLAETWGEWTEADEVRDRPSKESNR